MTHKTRTIWTFAITSVALFMVTLDNLVVTTALPVIRKDLDASLLQMATLRLFPPDDPRIRATVDAVWKGLTKDGWLFRYKLDDGFGTPKVAFIICTFWLIEALAVTGRLEEARGVMKQVHAALSPIGLISEDYATADLRMWGNFPQAYSHVGLIHAAFAASPRWADVL